MKSLIALVMLAGCGASLKVQPVTVNPIHVTVDVNVHDEKPAAPALPAPSH